MVSTFTTNKHLEKPAHNDYIDTWEIPVNANENITDSAFGGVTSINVTAVVGPTITLSNSTASPPSYICPMFILSGTLGANLNYQFPSGVGGQFSVYNNTTGAFSLTFSSAGGGTSVVIPQGARVLIEVDGTNVTAAFNEVTILGIGMVPVNILDILKTQNTDSIALITNANAGVAGSAAWAASNGTHGVLMRMHSTGFTTSNQFRADGALFYTDGAGGMGYSIPSDQHRWWINNVNTMNLTASALNGPGWAVNHDTGSGSSFRATGFGTTGSYASASIAFDYGGGFQIANNLGNGQVLDYTTGNWGHTSDERRKTDLKPIKNAVAKIEGVRTVTGRMKGEKGVQPFLIAQDWKKFAPSLVTKKWKDGKPVDELMLAYANTAPYAFAAIKELAAEIRGLKEEVKTLKAALRKRA